VRHGCKLPSFGGIVAGMRKLDRSMIFPALAMLTGVLLLTFYALLVTLPMWAPD
jgi:hypothetical protein